MAYEYDRFEREDGGGSFLMGLLAGTVLGAGLGMLFAPKAGSELRNQLGEQAGRLRTTAADGYQQATEKVSQGYQQATEKVSQIVDRGKEAYDRARAAKHRDRQRPRYDEHRRARRPATPVSFPAPGRRRILHEPVLIESAVRSRTAVRRDATPHRRPFRERARTRTTNENQEPRTKNVRQQ